MCNSKLESTLIDLCFVLFLVSFYVCVCECLLQNNMRMYTSIHIHRSEAHCGSAVRFGQALLGFLITAPPSVCVSAVLDSLAVWIQQKKKQGCGRQTPSARNVFSRANLHMFLKSKCRGDSDLGLCIFWVLANREPLRNAKFRFFLRATHAFSRKSPVLNGSLFASTQKVHRPRSQSPLHFDMRNI